MRITVQLDDDVLESARSLAREQGVSLGAALSALARRGLSARPTAITRQIPGFSVAPDSQRITAAMVRVANGDGSTGTDDRSVPTDPSGANI